MSKERPWYRRVHVHRLLKPKPVPQGDDVEALQRAMNQRYLNHRGGWAPLKHDGIGGDSTFRAAFHLAWERGVSYRSLEKGLTVFTQRKLKGTMPFGPFDRRRARQRKHKDNPFLPLHPRKPPAAGLKWLDGKWGAAWVVDDLLHYRVTGQWHGIATSLWRSREYSESLCKAMCGAPSCPGRCAGVFSRHVGIVHPNGAGDVTDYDKLLAATHRDPRRLVGGQLPLDPVHFSADGH